MSQDKNSKKIRRRVRRAYAISTMSITLVLFMLGAVGYLILNARMVVDSVRESVAISVMLKDGLTSEAINKIGTEISKIDGIKHSDYKSKDDATKDFKEFMGAEFDVFLEENPIPASYDVTLLAQKSDIDAVKLVVGKLEGISGVREVLYQDEVIRQLTDNLSKVNLILAIFGGALLLISIMLINNTIRITIASKRFVINTMKLVGATAWFIKRPFIGRGVLYGVIAGIISSVMLALSIVALNKGLPEIGLIKSPEHLAFIFVGMIAMGVLISVIFTAIAVSKFVRAKSNRVYIY